MTPELQRLVAAFQRWLYLPDPDALLVTMATVAANRLEGNPVWALLVSPPSTLKTEILQATSRLDDVHLVSDITEAGLISGVASKDRTVEGTGGLLAVIGDFGVVVCKDFTTVINAHNDKRQAVFNALREIYDGEYRRHLGSDGGKELCWTGKLGFLAGVTPVIDTHHSVMASMGERFVLYRVPELDEDQQARGAVPSENLVRPVIVENFSDMARAAACRTGPQMPPLGALGGANPRRSHAGPADRILRTGR